MIHAPWSYSAVTYEVNIRQYTKEGTFKAFEDHLDRIATLGANILWFMPIYPIGVPNRKGSMGSYYSISDYTAVNPEFGTIDDFKSIVAKAHKLGMKVILDMVTNHTAWDNKWIIEGHSDWYVRDVNGDIVSPFDWSDTAKLNYDNKEMRRAMIDAMKYWITEVDIDGYRQDMAGLVPLDFWREAVPELRSLRSDLFMLGEVESPDYHVDNTFDVTYDWDFHHLINRIARLEDNADSLRRLLKDQSMRYTKESARLLFTSNHDENSWSGSEHTRMGAAAKCFAALTYILDGMPLIYSGQEGGNAKQLEFFEKDLIDWSSMQEYSSFYKELNDLKHNNPALAYGSEGGDVVEIASSQPYNLISVKRKKGDNIVIGIFNLTPYHVQPAFYDADYRGIYHKLWHGDIELCEGAYDPFAGWECKIYWK